MKAKIGKITGLLLAVVLSCSTVAFTGTAYGADGDEDVDDTYTYTPVASTTTYKSGDALPVNENYFAAVLGANVSYATIDDGLVNWTHDTNTSFYFYGDESTTSGRFMLEITPAANGTLTATLGDTLAEGKTAYLLTLNSDTTYTAADSIGVYEKELSAEVTSGTTYYLVLGGTDRGLGSISLTKSAETEATVSYATVFPTVSGFVSTYDFKDSSSDTVKLVTQSNDSYSEGSAYAANAGTDYDEYCYVELTADGAVLVDNSASSSTRMIVPYENMTSKVRVYGSVIPTNAVSTNWRMITFGNGLNLGVNKNKSMYIDLAEDLSASTGTTDFGTVVVGQAIEFDLTFDLDSCTATGTITNGSASGEVNMTWDSSTKYTQRVTYYTTLSQAGDTARTIVVPSVSFEETPVFDADSMTITGVDGTVYYVVPVTEKQQSESSGYYLVSTKDSTVRTEEGDTVYIGLSVDGVEFSLSDLGISDPYVVAFEVSGTKIDVDSLSSKYSMEFISLTAAEEE